FVTAQVAFREGTVRTIEVALIATSTTSAAAEQPRFSPRSAAAANCTPTRLVPKFQKPDPLQNIFVPQAQLLHVIVMDDCNNPLAKINGGGAQVTFGNRDRAVDLVDQGNGTWEGTWNPVTAKAQVDLTVLARGS